MLKNLHPAQIIQSVNFSSNYSNCSCQGCDVVNIRISSGCEIKSRKNLVQFCYFMYREFSENSSDNNERIFRQTAICCAIHCILRCDCTTNQVVLPARIYPLNDVYNRIKNANFPEMLEMVKYKKLKSSYVPHKSCYFMVKVGCAYFFQLTLVFSQIQFFVIKSFI